MPAPARMGTRTAVTVADGVRAFRVEAPSPLPPTLDLLLGGIAVTARQPFVAVGTRRDCTDEQHDFRPWLAGVYAGLELRLLRCPFCGTVAVWDVSLDLLPGIAPGRSGPRRRSVGLGWY